MIAYGLIGLAVVLYILGLTDSYESGLSIKPMDQFAVYPLFGDGPGCAGTRPPNATLWMGLAVLSIAVLMVMGTGGRAVIPSRSQSMAELAYGFIRKDGGGRGPARTRCPTFFPTSSRRSSSSSSPISLR